jgi:NAD-dependent SIR2 family protein deacetylase
MPPALDPLANRSIPAPGEQGRDALLELLELLERARRLLVLTGAGCSTASGIPDYRDEQGAWKRTPPMPYQQFAGSAAAQQRYWARALIGWRALRERIPNAAHHVLARLEQSGRLETLITQNVDGLHQRAGSRNVIDLHGRIDAVECLQCARHWPRERVQERLEQLNPQWIERAARVAPDGDAVLVAEDFSSFQLVRCEHCEGTLKPAVVFFGESVPEERVRRAYAAVQRADAMLVVGSSLMVYSGYRFVRHALERGIPVAIINLGRTRADAEVSMKIEEPCAAVLERIERGLGYRAAD